MIGLRKCIFVFSQHDLIMEKQDREVRSILIIDDDQDDYDLVIEALQEINPNIMVHYASCCDEAKQFKNNHFDLVLLDINMPEHDGFHWLKAIREHGYDLPIIMYTNSLSPAHIAKAYEEGANLYFSKPESFTNLIKGFNKLISLDWSNPFSITEKHRMQGDYRVFQYS